ncbi:MAG: undecaprenyldiphospho-muramoylpentapeptide beta-N-acetylglucosaminyltransferase [Candidatus Omnitrophica bacterium]|nr:undecaprenyldiphospho-muramoylpentapeptide beta-N-acetylglucosaminyltransferase [Candidatus Omnitrophota bacterium]
MKILVVAGLSGGHIFPALSFLETLKGNKKNIATLLILPKKVKQLNIPFLGDEVRYISISPIRLRLNLKNISAIFNLLKGFLESLFILVRFRPDIVVGFGSIVCVPVFLIAWLFRIKTVIHEQNVIPGRATHFLSMFAERIAISFVQTENYLRTFKSKIVFTGNPLRKDLTRYDKKTALNFFGFKHDRFTMLVMGGSQASHRINFGFLKAISDSSYRFYLQVIHLSGQEDFELIKKSYSYLKIQAKVFIFLKEMGFAYSASDLIISRAGATTIAEVIFYKIPAILIPYPFAYQHQLANALILQKLGTAFIIKDDELETDRLRKIMEDLIRDPERLKKMASGYSGIYIPEANKILMNEVLSLMIS